ncbi:MAG: hypothetical protein IJH12_02485 [Clostridia bacterium]|nr:hypothetical protein [Clostridia bacterium]
MEEEKLGKMVIDGAIVDLDNTSADQLEEYVKKLKKREDEIEAKINSILDK